MNQLILIFFKLTLFMLQGPQYLLERKSRIFIIATLVIVGTLVSQVVNADLWDKEDFAEYSGVWIPDDEFIAYFDAGGIYTVVGVIKNFEEFPVIPTIAINIQDDEKVISKSFEYVAVFPSKELPFKIKFPEVTSKSPILESPDVSYIPTEKTPLDVEVIYDDTLVKHEDGHLTGRIINSGNSTVYNVKVFAIIHGFERILDMGQNMEMIEKMEPGEIRNFSMYPDPSITEEVYYYSCFAPSDVSVIQLSTIRNGEKFYFRYDSGSWYYDAKFNEEGTELSMKTYFTFQLETYASFEFARYDSEKYNVYLNGEPKPFIQSIDEYGNSHVSFGVEPRETGELLITGFAEEWKPVEGKIIPDWIRNNAKRWSEGRLVDYIFVRGFEFMINEEIINISTSRDIKGDDVSIPNWVRNNAGWWANGLISDDDFVNGIKYLVEHGIIKVSLTFDTN